jgi:hypothetical protein
MLFKEGISTAEVTEHQMRWEDDHAQWTGKDEQGHNHGQFLNIHFPGMGEERHKKSLVRIASVLIKIQTQHLLYTNQTL